MASGKKLDPISSWSPSTARSSFYSSILIIISVILLNSVVVNPLKQELDEECRELRLRQSGTQLTKIKVDGGCPYYAYCVGSKAELGICPKGWHFNTEIQDCDLVERAKCVGKDIPGEMCPSQQCGIHSDPETCSKLAICSEGRTMWDHECPKGSRFDISAFSCRPEGKVACPNASPEKGIPATDDDVDVKKSKSGEYDPLCSKYWKGAVSKVAHPKDCSRYFYCYAGKARLAACPLGLLFNSSSGHCDYVDNLVPCASFNLAAWTMMSGKECISRPCGVYPSGDCEAFVECQGGQGTIKRCKEGFKFDTQTSLCQPAEQAICWDRPSPSEKEGFDRNVGGRKSTAPLCPFHHKSASKPAETETNGVVLLSRSDLDLGDWSAWKTCPQGKYVNGLQNFRRMMMAEESDVVDHAGLTTIAFLCNTPEEFPEDKPPQPDLIDEIVPGLKRRPLEKMNYYKCDTGPAVGFQLNQVMNQGSGDDLATDWIRLVCGCGPDATKPYDKVEFKEVSGTRGVWTEAKVCGARQSLCGLSAQLHPWVENKHLEEYDNTGINGVRMKCCDVPSPATKYIPRESTISVKILENFDTEPSKPFQVELLVGLLYNRTERWDKAINFYESIGYSLYSLNHPFQKHFSENISCLATKDCMFDWASQRESVDEGGMWGLAATTNVTINVQHGSTVEVMQVVGTAGPYVIGTFNVKEITLLDVDKPQLRTFAAPDDNKAKEILNPRTNIVQTFDAATCPFMPREEETVHFSKEEGGFVIASKPRKDFLNTGTWGEEDECEPGKFVVGISTFRSQVLGKKKKEVDYAGLTSIAFKCESPGLQDSDFLSFSAPGLSSWPVWNNSRWSDCDEGAAIGFEINAKQELTKEQPDDFATDNIKLHCSCGPSVINPFDDPQLDDGLQGIAHGSWRKGRYCSKRHAVCGLQTQMFTFQDEYDPNYDNTGLNEIRVKCCKVPDPMEKFVLEESRQLLASLTPDSGRGRKPSTLIVPIGIQLNNSKVSARRMNFYESIGYPIADMREKLKKKVKVLGKKCQPQCMYHWEQLQPQILQDVQVHEESVVVPEVSKGAVVEYYQVVASIGFFMVRTNKYIIVTDDNIKKKEIAVTVPFEDGSRKRKGSAWNSVKKFKDGEDGDDIIVEAAVAGEEERPLAMAGRSMVAKVLEEEKREPVGEGNAVESQCHYHNLPPSESHEMTDKGIILPSAPKLLDNGEWREWQHCPPSQYIVGITAYREILETGDGGTDKVGLTALGFICQNPADENVGRKDRGLALASAAINSSQLLFSTDDLQCPRYLWKRWYFCRPGYVMIGFQTLSGLPKKGESGDGTDFTGVQNMKMFCSSGKEQSKPYDDNYFAGANNVRPSWGDKQICKRGQAVCGAQVQIQDIVREANDLKEFDNTGVNNINLKCCDVPFPQTLETFQPSEKRVLIMDVDRLEHEATFREYYNVTLEVGTEMSKSNLNCFYTSVGYDMSIIKHKFEKHVTTEGAVPCTAKRCDINWQAMKPGCFNMPTHVTSKHKVLGGQRVKTYQVVGDAGLFNVKTNQYVQHIINKEARDGATGRGLDDWDVSNKWILFEMPLANNTTPQLKLKVFDEVTAKKFDGKVECEGKLVTPIKEEGKKKGFYDLISSPRITDNGEWQEWIQCPKGSFISGLHAFRRVILEGGEDQLGLSSVGFLCTTPNGQVARKFGFVTQNLQPRNWSLYEFTKCDSGYATGFQLNVMPDKGPEGDDIATDNLKLFCSCSAPIFLPFNSSESRQFPGPGRGEWSKRQSCPPQTVVCAVRIQSEPYEDMGVVDLGQFDNTAINNIEMRCCRPPPLMEACNATERKVLVGSCDNLHNENAGTCEFISSVGYQITTSGDDRVLKLFGSLGVDIGEEVETSGKKLIPCKGPDCLYSWETAPTEVWSKLKEEPRIISIRGNAKVDLYQIIGECSFAQIRSNRYIISRNKFGNKTTEVWDVGDDQVTISGRSFGRGGRDSISCPFHRHPTATYITELEPVVGPYDKVIGTGGNTSFTIFSAATFEWHNCQNGYFIVGIRDQGKGFICMDPLTGKLENIGTGDKSATQDICEHGGVVVGVQLKDSQGGYNLICSYGRALSNTNEPSQEDLDEGHYCGRHMAACSFAQAGVDFKVRCCPVDSPIPNCEPAETRIYVKDCENHNTIAEKCELSAGIGMSLRNTIDYEKQTCFHSSVGYDDVVKHIPNFKQKMLIFYSNSSCLNCLYPWDESKAVIWIKDSIGSHEITMNPSEKAKVYQIVGTCGNIQVKTDGFVKMIESGTGEVVEQLMFV